MADYPTDRCRSCRAEIIWAATRNNEAMPVNARPDPGGNVILARVGPRTVAGVLGRGQAAGARDRGTPLYRSHFADCPDAARHRRNRR